MRLGKMSVASIILLVSCLISTSLSGRVKRQRIIFPDDAEALRSSTTPATCDCVSTTTNEYNPVCGSDGETYFNPQKLKCAAKCGKNVRLVRGGRCKPLIG